MIGAIATTTSRWHRLPRHTTDVSGKASHRELASSRVERQRVPAEHRAVKALGALHVAGVEHRHRPGAQIVDEFGAPVRTQLQDADRGPGMVGKNGRPPSRKANVSMTTLPPASTAFAVTASTLSTQT